MQSLAPSTDEIGNNFLGKLLSPMSPASARRKEHHQIWILPKTATAPAQALFEWSCSSHREHRLLCPVTLSPQLMRGAQHWQLSCVAVHNLHWTGSYSHSQPSARACRHRFNSLRPSGGRHTASTQSHSAWESSRACTRFSHTHACHSMLICIKRKLTEYTGYTVIAQHS